MNSNRVGRLALILVGGVGGLAGALAPGAAALAQPVANDLPVGSCITAYGNSGKIIDKVQGGYRMQVDGDPNGTPSVVSAASARPAACTGGQAPAPAPAAVQGAPAGLKVGACVTAYGQSGKIAGVVQGGYRIASDADPQGVPFVAAASSVRSSACAAAVRPAAAVAAKVPVRAPHGPAPAQAPVQHAAAGCPGSSSPAGLSGRDKSFASALLSNWTTPARPGEDGATTAKIQSLVIGAARPANFADQRNFSVRAGASMYPGRVKFTLCVDYRTRASYHYGDENVTCYASPADGSPRCSLAAHTAGLENPRDWEVLK